MKAWIATLALTSCTWQQAGFGSSAALISSDYTQTELTSDGGEWDRVHASNGHMYREYESDPLLGRFPSHGALTLATLGVLAADYGLYRSSLPSWVKATAWIAADLIESYMVISNTSYMTESYTVVPR